MYESLPAIDALIAFMNANGAHYTLWPLAATPLSSTETFQHCTAPYPHCKG